MLSTSTGASASVSGAKPVVSGGGGGGVGGSVQKRLQNELMQLMMSGNRDVTAFPEEDNVFQWTGSIKGGVGSAYEGMTFKLRLAFPADYPFSAPKVTFVTPCWHPNVDAAGNICLDILKDKWTAAYSALTVLLSLQTLLGDPNNDSPLNTQAAGQWADQAAFRRLVIRKYKEATGAAPTSGPLE